MKWMLFVIAVMILNISSAQHFNQGRLDSFFNALDANQKFMGSIALSQNGKIIYTHSIGFRDIAQKIKPDVNTRYRIGSITKSFTAVLVMKAVEEHKLVLTQTIAAYFPSIKNADKITVSDLLSHRSGIHNFTDDPGYLTWNSEPKSNSEMLDIIVKAGSDFEPGSKYSYSNSNYVLLSLLLEKLYGKSYKQVLNEKIIKPLHLTNTFYGGKINPSDNEAYSYRYAGTFVKEKETDMSVPSGAGAIVSTPTDLTLFADALFNGKLVTMESVVLMETMKDNYGLGLLRIPFYDKTGYGHTGGIDGFSSVYAYFPNEKVGYAFTSNGTNFDNNKISIAALSAVFDKPFQVPAFTAFALKPGELDQYLGVYHSNDIQLVITITKKENILMAQATGQPSFPLDAIAKDHFRFEQAGILIEFKPASKEMVLTQNGKAYQYKKE